ncbi:MAG: DUF4178 domain-containing protein [Planctomycetota bacterium]
MKRIEAPCPACGAPVEFHISSSLVTVCEHCSSVVARGDRKLEDLGRTAALVETLSPLHLGQTGTYRGKSFELVGHSQYQHASGAIWDEWYALVSNGKWIWCAEAQGRYFVTVQRTPADTQRLPDFTALEVGQNLQIDDQETLTVAEFGTTRLAAAAGELPFRPDFARTRRYVDLSGPNGKFATLDFDETPATLYLGQQVTLTDIGLRPPVLSDDEQSTRTIGALQLACPQCGGALSLHAPDRTERVVCPYCQAELDSTAGTLRYLQTLKQKKVSPLIPLGTTGVLRGVKYTVIGFLRRMVKIDGQFYQWSEFLLYEVTAGFRWLVYSDGSWSFVTPLAPGEVSVPGGRPFAVTSQILFQDRTYSLYQRCPASVNYVLGEFYWKVTRGERVWACDFINPPDMISVEITMPPLPKSIPSADRDEDEDSVADAAQLEAAPTVDTVHPQAELTAQEINFSHGVYVQHQEVQEAFSLPRLAPGFQVAPHQPNPVDKRVYLIGFLLALGLFALSSVISMMRPAGTVSSGIFWMFEAFILVVPISFAIYSSSFERSRKENSYIQSPPPEFRERKSGKNPSG